MIRVKIIALGRLKEDYLRLGVAEYEKRLKGYCNFEVVELTPKTLGENPSAAETNAALEKEAEMIIKSLPKASKIVAMCIEGKQHSSEELAVLLDKAAKDTGSITFIIGSSFGLSARIKALADVKLSMSKMTFPHQIARMLLLEQIYRGFKINEGSAYHK